MSQDDTIPRDCRKTILAFMTITLFMILENVRILSTTYELQGVFSDFGEFRNYYEFLEEYLTRYPDESPEKYEDEKLYPNIFRKSFIITCCSYFEKELFTLCKNLNDVKSLPCDVTDLKGKGMKEKGIKLYMYYLKTVDCIDISDNDYKTWNEILTIMKIRNFIVHTNGILDSSDKENANNIKTVRLYIDKHLDMLSIKGDEILIYADFCRHVVNTFENFHREICLKE